jgi:hypothetical protein
MFSRRFFMKLVGAAAVTPAAAVIAPTEASALPVANSIVMKTGGYQFTSQGAWRNDLYREYVRENLFAPYIGPPHPLAKMTAED